MCGIAGIMFKNGRNDHETGVALIDMLDGGQHRGRDSTGFAGAPRASQQNTSSARSLVNDSIYFHMFDYRSYSKILHFKIE